MQEIPPIPHAAILAGGKARRMGADKAELLLRGVPLIQWVWNHVSRVCARVVVVGGPARRGCTGAETIADLYPDVGSLGGIATALHHARQETGPDTWVLCVACDMPFLEPRLLLQMWDRRHGWDVVVPRLALGFEPLCCLYNTRCLPAVTAQLGAGNRRIRDLFRAVPTCVVPARELRAADPELRSFININHPRDLDAAERTVPSVA